MGKFAEDEKALIMHDYDYAVRAHGNQKRDEGLPYQVHLVGAVKNYVEAGGRIVNIVRICLLHDVKEDTDSDVSVKDFGLEVAGGVDILTKPKRKEVRPQKKSRVREVAYEKLRFSTWEVIVVKLSERLDNVRTLGPLSIKRHAETLEPTREVLLPIFESAVNVSSEPEVVRTLIRQLRIALNDAEKDLEDKIKEHNARQKRKSEKQKNKSSTK